jgi:hypothetical protein
MAHARVSPQIRIARRRRGARFGSYPGGGLQRHLVGRYGPRGVAFLVSPVSMTFDPVARGVVAKASRALCTSLSRMAVVVCPATTGAV